MKKYLEVFDVLYEIKDSISDKNFMILNNIFKELCDKIEEYEKKEKRSDKYYGCVFNESSDSSEDDSDEQSENNNMSLRQYIENMNDDTPPIFTTTNLDEYLHRTQGINPQSEKIEDLEEKEIRDAVPVKDLDNPSRIVFFVIDNGELNLVELDSNNLGEIIGPVEENVNGNYEFKNKKWKLK